MSVAMDFTKRIIGDMDAAERFYREMGLKLIMRVDVGEGEVGQEQAYMSVTGDASSHQLILCRFHAFPPPARPVYPGEAWLVFNVDDVDETCRTAEAFGGSVFRSGQDRPEHGVRAAVVADVDGHYIEVVGPMR
jgi:catechol 2,3-dioxygenase-like lactoylglutathione lyase family enzyme